jgi:hypothetical protein
MFVLGSAFALSAGMFIRHRFALVTTVLVSTSATWSPYAGHVRAATAVPPLPPPTGAIVNVSTEPQLQAAIQQLASNTTILIAPGTYQLTSTLYINGTYTNVAIRGSVDDRDSVVLKGPGMSVAAYGQAPYGIWTGGNVQGVTIANLTIRDFYYHPIIFNAGTQRPRVYNVHLIDAGQQFLKSNPDGAGGGVNDGIVEYSVIEYTTTARDPYVNGVDVHTGANWIIRDNVFRNLVAPPGGLAGPALLMWNHSSNTLTERNLFINCARGISYGLQVAGFDHSGGIIRNNMISRGAGQSGDVGIMVADSPNTQVLNNTVYLSGTYGTPIEYRFAGTQNVVIGNNLLDGAIWARDGATGTEAANLAGAQASMFVNAAGGDLHLVSSATSAIDRGLNSVAVTSDFDGQARPQGMAYDIGADEFGATAITYYIVGRVVDVNGAAVASTSVALSGSQSRTATTDANGAFSFASLAAGGTYTVTPSKSGYTFTPTDTFFSALGANQIANFTAVAAAPAPPPSVPLAVDVVASGDQTNASNRTLKTNNFSTAAASELLLAFVSADDSPTGGTVVSSVAAGGLTWQLVRRTNAQVGTAEIWRAFAPARLSNVSVTATLSAAQAGSITVVTFTGADASGSNGSGAIGATGSGSAAAGAPTATLTTTRNNSWVFGVGNDWDHPVARTLGPNQTMVHQYMPSVGDTYWVQRMASATAASGTSVTINDTAPTADRYNLTIVEVLPASGAASPPSLPPPATPAPPSVNLTAPASGATYTAPASMTVSASATANGGATIAKVDFFAGTTAIGSGTTAPYSIAWSGVAAASYSLTAVATDSLGASTRSAPVTITVNAPATPPPPPPPGGTPSTLPLVQQSSLQYLGSFAVPSATLGSTYGFNAAGTGGLGTYAVAFNPARKSIFLGGHPYEQRVAELAIPASLTGTPTATALQNLIDPLEGKLGSINPTDPNSKVIGSALVYNNQLFIGAFSYYDGAGTQTRSEFSRPLDLSTKGQVIGPVKIGDRYPGWVDKYATLIPSEWQAAFGGPALAGGTLGAINSLQSWGPSATVFDPAQVNTSTNVAGVTVLGYPYGTPLADTMTGNQYLSQADFITGMVFPSGTRSVLFFGRHGLGNYCYGTGGTAGDCYDPDDNSKGIHSYPYRSQVWAYDANDLAAVKAGQKQPYQVMPYAVWPLDASFQDIQGVAYDPAAQRLYVSQVYADNTRPLIRVYQIVVQ